MVDNLILLRGLLREKGHWGDFPSQVQEALGSQTNVICIDLPGVGEFAKVSPPFSVFGMAEFIHQRVLERTKGSVGLCAVSLGGMVALEMLAQFSSSYSKVMVINTSSKMSSRFKRMRVQLWKPFLHVLTEVNPVKKEQKIVPIVVNSSEGREAAEEVWTRVAKERKMHPLTMVAQLKAAANFMPADHLRDSKDILLISSLGDRLVDSSCSELLHKRYGWEHHVHPWGGHDLAWDDPGWLLAEIKAFFS